MSPRAATATLALWAAVGTGGLSGCRGEKSDDPPILPERNMYDTERYNPESYSQFFPDHRTMRTPVEGTVARDRYEDDPEVASGLLPDKSAYVMTVPPVVVSRAGGIEKELARGQERFTIYCTPCHGQTGDGKGMVVCKRDKVPIRASRVASRRCPPTKTRGSVTCRTVRSSRPSPTASGPCRRTGLRFRSPIAGPSSATFVRSR